MTYFEEKMDNNPDIEEKDTVDNSAEEVVGQEPVQEEQVQEEQVEEEQVQEEAQEEQAQQEETQQEPTDTEEQQTKPEKKKKDKKRYTRGQMVFVSLIAVFLTIVITSQLVFSAATSFYKKEIHKNNENSYFFSLYDELTGLYQSHYLYSDEIDVSVDDLLRQYVISTNDRYAMYYSPEEWYLSQESSMGKSAGIGAYVSLDEAHQCINIIHVFKDSPAEKAGLKAKDIVVGVDGKYFTEIGLENGYNSIPGENGTKVRLTIIRDNAEYDLIVKRGDYIYQSVLTDIIKVDDKKIGYMHILQFIGATFEEFKIAAKELKDKGCVGVVIDVRNNPGGQLDTIVNVLDYIEPEGGIVEIYDSNGKQIGRYNSKPSEYDMPLAILCNESTASAAELMTKSLMDTGKAKSFGVKTYGKGCGQSAFQLSNGAVVYITSFFYKTPYSDNYDGIGITPDYVVDYAEGVNSINLFMQDYENDTQLQAAVRSLID